MALARICMQKFRSEIDYNVVVAVNFTFCQRICITHKPTTIDSDGIHYEFTSFVVAFLTNRFLISFHFLYYLVRDNKHL